MRKGGNIERAVRRCLALPPESRPIVRLAIGAGLVSERLADELLESRCEGVVSPGRSSGGSTAAGQSAPSRGPGVLRSSDVPPAADWPYLTHWTRDQHGPWPGESREEYLAKCVRGDPDCDRSALAALVHIVQSAATDGYDAGHPRWGTGGLFHRNAAGRTGPASGVPFAPRPVGLRVLWFMHPPKLAGSTRRTPRILRRGRGLGAIAAGRAAVLPASSDTISWRPLPHRLDSGARVEMPRKPRSAAIDRSRWFIVCALSREAMQLAAISRWPVVVLGPTDES